MTETETKGTREDRRSAIQLRPIDTEQGLLNRADGSARYTQGKSTVIAAVYGPLEVKRGAKEQIDRATIDVVWKPRVGPSEYVDREKEFVLRSIIEGTVITTLHPRTSISVIVQVIQDDGAILSTAINAICLALIDAGLPMNYVPISTTCIVKDEQIYLDPTEKEEQEATAHMIFTFSSASAKGVVMSKTLGEVQGNHYFDCLNVCRLASHKVVSFVRIATESKAAKAFN